MTTGRRAHHYGLLAGLLALVVFVSVAVALVAGGPASSTSVLGPDVTHDGGRFDADHDGRSDAVRFGHRDEGRERGGRDGGSRRR